MKIRNIDTKHILLFITSKVFCVVDIVRPLFIFN